MNKKNADPIFQSMRSDTNLKEYRCPHCNRFLFNGMVKKLNMVCHHCLKSIIAGESELLKPKKDET
jgi:hypothetical protein